jgi:DNA modification methylase
VNEIRIGDCVTIMKLLILSNVKIQTCVTSPPYFGLRDYGVDGQIGLESTPSEYVARMVEVFRLVRDLLAEDGTLWLNLGDSYASGMTGRNDTDPENLARRSALYGTGNGNGNIPCENKQRRVPEGLKPKDLIGIPWRVAFALQADGWYLRSDIIWAKPNPMPESIKDRPTKSHEYLFLLSKSQDYFYDSLAIQEPSIAAGERRGGGLKYSDPGSAATLGGKHNLDRYGVTPEGRNRRSVWTIATQPYDGAHFATFPQELILPCVLAGSRAGDIVFDPFIGSGTTALVAKENGRRYLGCELNPEYRALWEERLAQEVLFGPEVTA